MLFLNLSAAKRILGVKKVFSLKECKNGAIQVTYQGVDSKKCSTFISRKKFLEDAIAVRSERAKESPKVKYDYYQNLYTVQCVGGDQHTVTVNPKEYGCDCKDFEVQQKYETGFSAKPFCSHLLAVAYSKGFGSFRDLLAYTQHTGSSLRVA